MFIFDKRGKIMTLYGFGAGHTVTVKGFRAKTVTAVEWLIWEFCLERSLKM